MAWILWTESITVCLKLSCRNLQPGGVKGTVWPSWIFPWPEKRFLVFTNRGAYGCIISDKIYQPQLTRTRVAGCIEEEALKPHLTRRWEAGPLRRCSPPTDLGCWRPGQLATWAAARLCCRVALASAFTRDPQTRIQRTLLKWGSVEAVCCIRETEHTKVSSHHTRVSDEVLQNRRVNASPVICNEKREFSRLNLPHIKKIFIQSWYCYKNRLKQIDSEQGCEKIAQVSEYQVQTKRLNTGWDVFIPQADQTAKGPIKLCTSVPEDSLCNTLCSTISTGNRAKKLI